MFDLVKVHEDYICINKYEDVEFHGSGLVDAVREAVGGEIYPVHRLDKITSGLLLFARSKDVAHEICDQFDQKKVEKTYLALSDLKPKKKQGSVKGDLEKSRRGTWKLSRNLTNPSVTQFKSYSFKEGRRLFILYPKTGKTHQLRVVMKSLGSPILGDTSYGGSEADRAYLHCYRMKFQVGDQQFIEEAPVFRGLEFDESFKQFLVSVDHP